MRYCDLAEFGLPFVTPSDEMFFELAQDIEDSPASFSPPVDDARAALLLNQSGRAIIAFAYVWRYTTVQGAMRTAYRSNLSSSVQLDVLNGRARSIGTSPILFYPAPGD